MRKLSRWLAAIFAALLLVTAFGASSGRAYAETSSSSATETETTSSSPSLIVLPPPVAPTLVGDVLTVPSNGVYFRYTSNENRDYGGMTVEIRHNVDVFVGVTAFDGYTFPNGVQMSWIFRYDDPPTVTQVAIPAAPTLVDDPAVQGDAHYVVPNDTESLTWVKNSDGSVTVTTNSGYQFTDGSTSQTYAAPTDQYTPPIPSTSSPSTSETTSASPSSSRTSAPTHSATTSHPSSTSSTATRAGETPTVTSSAVSTGTRTGTSSPTKSVSTAPVVVPAQSGSVAPTESALSPSASATASSPTGPDDDLSSSDPSRLPHTGDQSSLLGTIVSGLFLVSALGGGAALLVLRKRH